MATSGSSDFSVTRDEIVKAAYRKLGGRVVYSLDDLQAWADRGAKTSTADPGVGTVLPAKRHPDAPFGSGGH